MTTTRFLDCKSGSSVVPADLPLDTILELWIGIKTVVSTSEVSGDCASRKWSFIVLIPTSDGGCGV